jgi:TnpA family transposase
VITDTAGYSDIVFGLFAICGYQFSPRIADITDRRLWRIDTAAGYGPFDELGRHRIRLDRIRAHWPDMLRVAGSLITGQVRAYDLIRMISRHGRPTGLGEAFAHYGRIFKTLHILQVLHDESYRRMIGSQLNLHESWHALARHIRHGQHGQLREHYRQGMENQLGAIGLVLNATVLWNTLYIDKAVAQLRAAGRPIAEELLAGLSPLITTTSTSAAATSSLASSQASYARCATPTPWTMSSDPSRRTSSSPLCWRGGGRWSGG